MNKKDLIQSGFTRHALIVVILVCVKAILRHGRDNMLYEFDNGTVVSKQDTTPNGTKMTRLYFKEYEDVQRLYDEINTWAMGLGCETTILLKRNSEPYIVVMPKLEESN